MTKKTKRSRTVLLPNRTHDLIDMLRGGANKSEFIRNAIHHLVEYEDENNSLFSILKPGNKVATFLIPSELENETAKLIEDGKYITFADVARIAINREIDTQYFARMRERELQIKTEITNKIIEKYKVKINGNTPIIQKRHI